jgi:hypothetical protein
MSTTPQPGWEPPQTPTTPPRKRHVGRNIALAVVGLIILGGIVGSLSGGSDTTATTAQAPEATSASGGISKGLGSADATNDIKLSPDASAWNVDNANGLLTVPLTITNHSSDRSDYYIQAALLNKAGDNIGTANALVQGIEPGQVGHADLTGTYTGKLDDVKITQVQRTASS